MRIHLKGSDIKDINEKLKSTYGLDMLSKKDKVELADEKYYFVNSNLHFFLHEGKIIPTLKLILTNNFLKKITVDMGAVRFVASGADVMRPGITAIDEGINKDDIISIVDIKNNKPLAIGWALFSEKEMKEMTSGKVIKNLHYVGDDIWQKSFTV